MAAVRRRGGKAGARGLEYDLLIKTLSGGVNHFRWADAIDIIIIAVLIYQLILLTKETRAYQVLKGVGMIFLAALVSDAVGLVSISWLLNSLLSVGVILAVVLFQPEIRRALEHIGRGKLFSKEVLGSLMGESKEAVNEMHQAITSLARRRVGALIVVERRTGLGDIINTGTAIEGLISAPLIENVFEPNTPLHDGAMIIRDGRIVAAACILPLAEDIAVSRELGTRHRAALGVSSVSDSVTIVVSEETGVISVARDGRLVRYIDSKALRDLLESLFLPREKETPVLNIKWRRAKDEQK